MRRKTELKTLSTWALLSALVLSPLVYADDTEIFFGQSDDAFNTNPNVLFVLDTSGSMGWWDEGFEGSRMDRLKIAMRVLLQESSSFNVGLMGFQGSDRGGSIRYPVGDLEGDSTANCPDGICPDETVVVRPSTSADDATQNDDTKVVTLDAPKLQMAGIESIAAGPTPTDPVLTETTGSAFATAVSAEAIDTSGTETNGDPISRAITGPSQWFYKGAISTEDDRYAYRFDNVAIPEGATITSATITFTQTNALDQAGNLSALIKLETTPTPELLPDGDGTTMSLLQRLDFVNSTAGVIWENIPPDTTGTGLLIDPADKPGGPALNPLPDNKARTPDLSDILNQVVKLPGWTSGNALSFILDPVDEYTPGLSDIRRFEGIDAIDQRKPVLNYTYTESEETDLKTTVLTASAHVDEVTEQNTDTVARNLANDGSRLFFATSTYYPRKVAFRFSDIDIPADAEIQTATLVLTGGDDTTESDFADWIADPSTVPATPGPGSLIVGGLVPGLDPVDPPDLDNGPSVLVANNMDINIRAEETGQPADYSADPMDTRSFTDAHVNWEDALFNPDESLSSPNLAAVVQAVINPENWNTGDDLSLLLSAPTAYNNVLANSTYVQTSTGANKPELHITWKANNDLDTTLSNTQTTAIRFQNVHVPPGAQIKSAKLVFKADQASIEPVELEISGENTAVSEALTDELNNIGARVRTAERVVWNADPWATPNIDYDSADLTTVVQAITNQDEWCGGNPMTLFIKQTSGEDSRHAMSYDQNPVSSPSLRITYSPDSVPSGSYCSNATLLATVAEPINDAVEDSVTTNLSWAEATLDSVDPVTGNTNLIGFRFNGIKIPKDANVISASLELSHATTVASAQDYTIKAVSSADNPVFNSVDAKISTRPTLATTITGTTVAGAEADDVFHVDITPLVAEKVLAADWESGDHIVLTAESSDSVAHSFYAVDGSESSAPRLVIYYQSERDQPGTRIRDNLIEIVDSMVAQSGTPIVGAYYEAANYFLGESVDYGLQRGWQNWDDRYHRVSHPGSYNNGTVFRDTGCTDADLNADACINEEVLPESGLTPTYVSPINSECQQNHIVILSDGQPTSNSAEDKIRTLTGEPNCLAVGDEECGVELATWLQTSDIDPVMNGHQNISTHTIGFNLDDPAFMQALAAAGDGGFYEADSAAELLTAFQNIFNNVSKTDTSFVAPSATVSQSNRMKNREDIYFSLFKPEGTARWAGNLKRYKLQGNTGGNADIADVFGIPAVDEATGRFKPTAKSFWSNVIDGDSVQLGGAAEKIEHDGISHLSREVYTYTGVNTDLTQGTYNHLLPDNPDLLTEWLKLPPTLESDADYVANLINWAHGQDIFDIDGDGNTEEARGQMGDPLHSQPLLVNYIGGQSVVHIATNEGFLHAIDHVTGLENFAFIPKELLKNLRRNFENEPTRNRPYGLDGGLTLWVDDLNNDGLVDPDEDKAYLYIGMRRGGDLYYALDISDPAKPKYLWSLKGGATTFDELDTTADGGWEQLGQTWSKPVKTQIYDNSQIVDVLIFGAGYGTNQDPIPDVVVDEESLVDPDEDTRQTRSEDSVGRGFFVINAITGKEIWQPDLNDPDLADMKYSVPSDLRVIDINFDGLVDQIYFGDMGGQVWRFDYNNDQTLSADVETRMTGGRIALFAGDTPESARRFYYPPDVALMSIEGHQQLAISIGSGWRAHPLDLDVEDRFYSFRMSQVYGAPTIDGQVRYPEMYEGISGLVELTDDTSVAANKEDRGWFIKLDRAGEKVLSSSVTIDGSVVFTTYLPSSGTEACAAAVGSGSLYMLDLATGNPVQDLYDSSGEGGGSGTPEDTLDSRDRRRSLSSGGIPPQVSVLFPEAGKATAFAGKDKLDEVDIPDLKQRTFWQEYIEENL